MLALLIGTTLFLLATLGWAVVGAQALTTLQRTWPDIHRNMGAPTSLLALDRNRLFKRMVLHFDFGLFQGPDQALRRQLCWLGVLRWLQIASACLISFGLFWVLMHA